MEKGSLAIPDHVAAVVNIGTGDMTDGERLTILRRRYRRTLADAAAATGIHPHRISDMERGIIAGIDTQYVTWMSALK